MAGQSSRTHLPGVYALELVDLVERWGVTAEELLEGSSVTLKQLEDPTTRVSLETCGALTTRAEALTGEPGLAVYFGLRMRLPSHGFLGFAAMTAGTLGEAARLAARFSRIRTDAIAIEIGEDGDHATFTLEDQIEDPSLRQFVLIAVMIGVAQLAYSLTGQKVDGRAECTFEAPPGFERFVGVLQGTVVFGQSKNRLLAHRSVLDLPIVGRDPVAMRLAAQQCERELAALDESAGFAGRVRDVLGKERAPTKDRRPLDVDRAPEEDMSLERVAKSLGMSTRTLKRKLAAEGTSFSDIVDERRRERALELCADKSRGVEEIAAMLGYSDVANFVRAFRRWTGMTPAAFRRR